MSNDQIQTYLKALSDVWERKPSSNVDSTSSYYTTTEDEEHNKPVKKRYRNIFKVIRLEDKKKDAQKRKVNHKKLVFSFTDFSVSINDLIDYF